MPGGGENKRLANLADGVLYVSGKRAKAFLYTDSERKDFYGCYW